MSQVIKHTAVKAIIVNENGEVLLLRKSNDDIRHAGKSGRYNLPGGKIKPNEKIADALKREVHEETKLMLNDTPLDPIFEGKWQPVIKGVTHRITGTFFVCNQWSGHIQLDSEHSDFAWINFTSINDYDILPPEDEAIRQYFARVSPS